MTKDRCSSTRILVKADEAQKHSKQRTSPIKPEAVNQAAWICACWAITFIPIVAVLACLEFGTFRSELHVRSHLGSWLAASIAITSTGNMMQALAANLDGRIERAYRNLGLLISSLGCSTAIISSIAFAADNTANPTLIFQMAFAATLGTITLLTAFPLLSLIRTPSQNVPFNLKGDA